MTNRLSIAMISLGNILACLLPDISLTIPLIFTNITILMLALTVQDLKEKQ